MTVTVTAKDRAADRRLRREFWITLDEYEKVLEYQGYCCAICKKPVQPGKPRLAVDHRHACGLLRGLLCWRCNRSLAVFEDNVAKLEAAIIYLLNPPFTIVFGSERYAAPGRIGTRKRAKLLKLHQESKGSREV